MAKKVPAKVQEIRNWKVEREAGSKSISFSQLSVYRSCPYCWYRSYIKNEAPFVPSIHLIFGTSIHECIQTWLDKLYNDSIKAAEELNLHEMLRGRMRDLYQKERETLGRDFSTAEELASFYEDGIAILDYVKRYRKSFFDPQKEWLVGCEIPLLYKLQDNLYFKGFIDILTYQEETGIWKIWDIKTSISSWSAETKKNKDKTDQVLLYKHFLSQEFGIDPGKIEVEYFIVKRKIPEDPMYPVMARRVQEFVPSNGPRNVKRAVEEVEKFCKDVLVEGQYRGGEFIATPSEKSCKWCLFNKDCQFVMSH